MSYLESDYIRGLTPNVLESDMTRQDVTYAIRLLRRSPVFTLTAVISLAIGLAANATIFSLADAILLRDRPGIRDEARVVDVGRSQDGKGFDTLSYPNYTDLRDRNTVFSGLAATRFGSEAFGLGSTNGAERVMGQAVSGNYFDVLGVAMVRGRGFRADEDRPGAPQQVVVISHALWQRRFGGAEGIAGTEARLNGRPFTIVGVTVRDFTGHTIMTSDLWLPVTAYPAATGRSQDLITSRAASWLMAIGRMKPGVTLEQARAQLQSIARDLERTYPRENKGRGVVAARSNRISGFGRAYVTAFLALLFALVGLILLIACTNVAGMLLARGVTRGREVAVRIAVGASRARIIRQLIVESVLLALAGAAAGVLLALWMIGGLQALLPDALPVALSLDLRIDWRVIGFSMALALFTGVLFGLVPALQAARTDLTTTLKDGAGGASARRMRSRQAFVVAQVAMSMLLVVCALLFARSLQHAGSIDPGFSMTNVDVAGLDFRLAGYDVQRGRQAVETLLGRVSQLPGVRAAGMGRVLPLMGGGMGLGRLRAAGDARDAGDRVQPDWNVVTPGYFSAMQIAILRGRTFTDADGSGTPAVAIVNETFARRWWPDGEALGQTIVQEGDPNSPPRTLHIVGVAKDGKYRSLGEDPRAFIYIPHAQYYAAEMYLVARGDGRRSLLPDMTAIARQLDPNLPITHSGTLSEISAVGLLPHRLAALVAGAFGLVGILLAVVGIYGITAFNVTQRRREIGVRVALGATRQRVLRLVVAQSMWMAMSGMGVGLAAACGATQFLASWLYGIRPLDPVSFAAGAGAFCALAMLASWLPARRAASVNPVDALRAE